MFHEWAHVGRHPFSEEFDPRSAPMMDMMTDVVKAAVGQKQQGGFTEVLGAATEMLKFAGEMRPEPTGGEDYPFQNVIEKFGAPLLNHLAEAAQIERERIASNVPPPQPIGAPAVEVGTVEPTFHDAAPPSQWVQLVTPWVEMLNTHAANDRDPGIYAAVVVDNLPEEHLAFVRNATAPGAVGSYLQEILGAFSDVARHEVWWRELLDGMHTELTAPMVEEPAPESPVVPPPAPVADAGTPPAELEDDAPPDLASTRPIVCGSGDCRNIATWRDVSSYTCDEHKGFLVDPVPYPAAEA